MTRLRPRRLAAGARVAVVAPASGFLREDFDRGLGELRALGLEPVVDERIFERHHYLAGSAERRAATLRDALSDPGVEGIIAARGGYGSVHLLPLLDPAQVRRARKPLIGHSDVTSLLQFVTLRCGLGAVHGPMVAGALAKGSTAYHRPSLLSTLMDAAPLGEVSPEGLEVLAPGEAAGTLLGGTLTQLCASMGTPFSFSPPGGFVLLLDEVNERPYRLDRLLTQLGLAGILSKASAVVFGELPGCDEPAGGLTARATVADLLRGLRIPLLWGFPTGHTSRPEWTLPLGVGVRVVAREPAPMLVFEEPAAEG